MMSVHEGRTAFADYRPFGFRAGHLRRFEISVGVIRLTIKTVDYEQAILLARLKVLAAKYTLSVFFNSREELASTLKPYVHLGQVEIVKVKSS